MLIVSGKLLLQIQEGNKAFLVYSPFASWFGAGQGSVGGSGTCNLAWEAGRFPSHLGFLTFFVVGNPILKQTIGHTQGVATKGSTKGEMHLRVTLKTVFGQESMIWTETGKGSSFQSTGNLLGSKALVKSILASVWNNRTVGLSVYTSSLSGFFQL